MISCEAFRARFAPASDEPSVLEHVRRCDACLTTALSIDPDILFRAVGGEDLLPPGGVDAFVGDVMREVRLRSTETSMTSRPVSAMRKLAIAATIAIGIVGASALYRFERTPGATPMNVARAALRPANLTSRPVVEAYDSESATIVEVATEGAGDVRLVMVFDETLPADL